MVHRLTPDRPDGLWVRPIQERPRAADARAEPERLLAELHVEAARRRLVFERGDRIRHEPLG